MTDAIPLVRTGKRSPVVSARSSRLPDDPDTTRAGLAVTDTDTSRFRNPVLLALLLAVVAFGSAILFARGPAVQDRTTHVWQPVTTEKSATESLVLVAGTPEELSVTLPCREPADLQPTFTFRTTPSSEGLVISGAEARLTIHIDGSELATVPWLVKETAEACRQTIAFNDRGLTMTGIDGIVRHQTPGPAPTVTLLAIDSTEAIDGAFRVDVTTKAHGSSPSGVQWLAGILALAFALGATGLALRLPQTQPPDRSSRERLSLSTLRPIWLDGLIVGSTVIWMFIGPAFFDDGWVLARHRSFAEVGRFTNYYTVAGVEMPLGYWNDWLAHWWTSALTAPIALRILPATLIVGGWLVLRLALTATAPPRWRNSLTTSTLAAGYLIGSSAWLMTLRPEPLVAVLCAISIYGVAVFLRRAKVTYLAAAAAAAMFAATSHPAGLVALAPLVAATPGLFRWSRARVGRALPPPHSAAGNDFPRNRAVLPRQRSGAEAGRDGSIPRNSSLPGTARRTTEILLARHQGRRYGAPEALRRPWKLDDCAVCHTSMAAARSHGQPGVMESGHRHPAAVDHTQQMGLALRDDGPLRGDRLEHRNRVVDCSPRRRV